MNGRKSCEINTLAFYVTIISGVGLRRLIRYHGLMTDGLSRLECNICGQTIYFAVPEDDNFKDGHETIIEVTCPRGHSDSFTPSELKSLGVSGRVELAYAAVGAAF